MSEAKNAVNKSNTEIAKNVSGSVGLTPNSKLLIARVSRNAAPKSDRHTNQREPDSLPNNQTQHVPRLRAQRDPHADLVRALSRRVTDRSVNTDRREQQSDRRKQSEQKQIEATLL